MLVYYKYNTTFDGLLAVYVDDTLAIALPSFKTLTEKFQEKFQSKRQEYMPLLCSVINVNKTPNGFFLQSNNYTSKSEPLHKGATFEDILTIRHRLA